MSLGYYQPISFFSSSPVRPAVLTCRWFGYLVAHKNISEVQARVIFHPYLSPEVPSGRSREVILRKPEPGAPESGLEIPSCPTERRLRKAGFGQQVRSTQRKHLPYLLLSVFNCAFQGGRYSPQQNTRTKWRHTTLSFSVVTTAVLRYVTMGLCLSRQQPGQLGGNEKRN
jgi:hypothetical protein